MSDSTLRPLTVFHYDSDESFSLELDTDPEPPQGNVFNQREDSSRPVEEKLDASFPSGFFKSCEEDDDEYMDGSHVEGGDNEVADSPKIIIFVVEGLGKQIDWELYGRFEVPGSKMIHIPLVAAQAINKSDPYNGMMNQAKSLLNIVMSHLASDASDASHPSHASPIAVGFWASDLATSIVKKVTLKSVNYLSEAESRLTHRV
ncbi:hypothetical protein H0G86_000200 [Trichoderma simmonsii]|uniref:Uncharacterized protein n=1 Tax=Trichoderma simmonsii TaxID=1491479 RepID=A0A8G0PB78_9HYPO|nr:hypothetical protein H0G86_000200 [Trichoderma simmonsii]